MTKMWIGFSVLCFCMSLLSFAAAQKPSEAEYMAAKEAEGNADAPKAAEAQPASPNPATAQPAPPRPAQAQPAAPRPAAAQPAPPRPAQAQPAAKPATAQPVPPRPAQAQPAAAKPAAQPAAPKPAQASPAAAPAPAKASGSMTESHVPPSGFTPGADLTLRIAVKNAPADLKVTLKYHTSATEPYILSPCSFVNGAYQATIRTDSFGRNPLYYIFDLSWTGAGGSALTKRATAQSWQDFTVASTAAETTYRVPDVALQTAAEVEAEYAAIQPGAPAAPGFFLGQGKLTTVKIIPKKKFPGWHYYFAYASGGKKDFRFIELTAPFYEQPEKVVSWDGVAVFMKLKDPSTRYYFLAQKDSGGRTYTVEYRDMSGAAVEIWTDTPDPEPETVSSHAPETRKPAPELKNTVTVEFPKTFQWNKPFRFGVKLQPKKKLTFIHLSYRLAGEDTFRGELIDIDKRSFDIVIPAEFTRVDRIEYYYSLIEGSREAIVNDSGKPFAAVVSDPPAQTPSVNTSMIADYFEGSATTGKTPFLFETRDLPAGFVPHVVMVRHGLSETEFPMTEQRPGSWVYVHTMPKNVGIDSSLGYYYVIRDAAGRLKYRLPEKGLMMNLFRKNSLRPFIPAEKNTQ